MNTSGKDVNERHFEDTKVTYKFYLYDCYV
jgi:hypothetical protein